MLPEIGRLSSSLELLIEKLADTSALKESLNELEQVFQDTFTNMKNEAASFMANCSSLIRRLEQAEVRQIKLEPLLKDNETYSALSFGIEEQEKLVLELEAQLSNYRTQNIALAKGIASYRISNDVLQKEINEFQRQCLAQTKETERKLASTNSLLNPKEFEDHQKTIHSLRKEGSEINGKIVSTKRQVLLHRHTANYTYGAYNGYAGTSSGALF